MYNDCFNKVIGATCICLSVRMQKTENNERILMVFDTGVLNESTNSFSFSRTNCEV